MSRTGSAGSIRRSTLILGLLTTIAFAGCGGSASEGPDATEDGGNGGSGDASDAFTAATDGLNALDSYVFEVVIKSTTVADGVTSVSHSIMSGQTVNRPTTASLLDMQELDENGNVTSETAFLIIGSDAWLRDGDADQPWTALPAAAAEGFVASMAAFRPEQIFGTYFAALGGDFSTAGTETKNGIQTTHYKGDEQVGAMLGAIAGFQGAWTSDAWIARDGGYLVHSEASAQAATGAEGGSFLITVDISQVNSAPALTPPPAG